MSAVKKTHIYVIILLSANVSLHWGCQFHLTVSSIVDLWILPSPVLRSPSKGISCLGTYYIRSGGSGLGKVH